MATRGKRAVESWLDVVESSSLRTIPPMAAFLSKHMLPSRSSNNYREAKRCVQDLGDAMKELVESRVALGKIDQCSTRKSPISKSDMYKASDLCSDIHDLCHEIDCLIHECYDVHGYSLVNVRTSSTLRQDIPANDQRKKPFRQLMAALDTERNRATYLSHSVRSKFVPTSVKTTGL